MRTQTLLESVRTQLSHVIHTIDALRASEFPYDDSQLALTEVHNLFQEHREVLNAFSEHDDPSVVEFHCTATFKNVRDLLPILGFILRSTNIRNAFEVWGPLRRLANQVLSGDTRLLLSSEWEYSPFTFIGYRQLPGFVFIGLPATESSNPFLLPLAGHELGHSVWEDKALYNSFTPILQEAILESIHQRWPEFQQLFPGYTEHDIKVGSLGWQTWQPSAFWAMRQAEESFCDYFGLRVFGESYLHACVYLLAPYRKGSRSPVYPNKIDRARALAIAAERFGYVVPNGFLDAFSDLAEPSIESPETKYLLSIADTARAATCNRLVEAVEEVASTAHIVTRSQTSVTTCTEAFRKMVPSEGSGGLANVLNAGWTALLEEKFFRDPKLESDRPAHLSELVLKSIEILEVETRQEGASDD